MKIIIHTQYYPPEMGAPQARLSDLARRLKNLGHEIEVLTAMPNYPTGRIFEGYPPFYMKDVIDGVPVYRSWILPSNKLNILHRLISYLSFCFSSLITGLIKIRKADVIITESPPIFLAAAGFLLAKLKGAGWIMNVSDLWPDSAKYIGMLNERGIVYRSLLRLAHSLYRKAWMVTGQSREIVIEIRRQVPEVHEYHLSNGADTERFTPDKASEAIRKQYLKNGEAGFIYAGLHGLFQGLDQILAVAEKIQDNPARFIFIGDGPEKQSLIKKAKDLDLKNVDFYPPLSHDQIPTILASMDVALVTLKSAIRGAVPSKIYEAMASGIPVLLAADGEAVDILLKAKAGIAVTPGDIDGFAGAVRELLSMPEQRKEMGRSGRLSVVTFYDRIKIAERFSEALRGAVRK